MAEFDEHRVGVVEWHDPAAHHWTAEGMLPVAVLPDRSHLLQVGQDHLHHSDPDIRRYSPRPDVHHTHPGVSMNSSSGSTPNSSVNWEPLTIVWRNAVWAGSMTFSMICSQLQG